MSDPIAPHGAEFLDGLTQVICEARAEYIRDYQDAWLAGKMSIGPDEFLALCAADYTRKHAASQATVMLTGGGVGPVKLPQGSLPSHVADTQIAIMLGKTFDILRGHGVIQSKSMDKQVAEALRLNTYNFIGALRKRSNH